MTQQTTCFKNSYLRIIVHFVIISFLFSCNSEKPKVENNSTPNDSSYAEIEFSNWKLTLPVDNDNNGKPDEYQPHILSNLGYRTIEAVKPYMYDDIQDTSLVFYCHQGGATTTNSNYPRTELRELIQPNNSKDNWTLGEGGEMRGRLKVEQVSESINSDNTFDRVIVMQIHGIISEEDMQEYSFTGNNGPPLIKIYWKDGEIWCHKKSLDDENTDGFDLYDVYNGTWTDIKTNMGYVGNSAFDFRITASHAKIEVQLNNNTPVVYEDISLTKWPFENYFKAGNYLISNASDAFSYIKYYSLNITH